MNSGWRYRVISVAGTVGLVAAAVIFANLSITQTVFSHVPYFGRPAPEVLANGALSIAVLTTLVVLLASMWPLFNPRPRRMLDTILLTQKRVSRGVDIERLVQPTETRRRVEAESERSDENEETSLVFPFSERADCDDG